MKEDICSILQCAGLIHDIGNPPFGHSGEAVLNKLMDNGFKHNEQSVRVVKYLENLNLCQETIDGILTHSWGLKPLTLEGQVVQIADKVAYINHDIDDAIRAGIIAENDLPKDIKLLEAKSTLASFPNNLAIIIYPLIK